MKFKIVQASDRIVIQLDGQDIKISFFAADTPEVPSLCTISNNGRESTRYKTRLSGKMEVWEFNLLGK